jgi:hypothetical protein
MIAKVRGSLAVSKKVTQKFDRERLNLRKLNELEVRKQYQNEITNRFAALDNINDSSGINRTRVKNYRESEVASSRFVFWIYLFYSPTNITIKVFSI